jgi:DNA-binding NarL/FixJ family response regulator
MRLSPDGQIDVVIVDDHELFSRGLELLVTSASGGLIRVAGVTRHGWEAPALVRRHRPGLVLVNVDMPSPGGVPAVHKIKDHHPQVGVLALSGGDDRSLALDALSAGADAFIPKSTDPDVVVHLMLTVAAGLSVLPKLLLESLLDPGAHQAQRVLLGLTEHDVTLWRLVANGEKGQDIATRLHVSERTAKRMVASLLRTLGVANRVQAAVLAGSAGLLDDTGPQS